MYCGTVSIANFNAAVVTDSPVPIVLNRSLDGRNELPDETGPGTYSHMDSG